MDPKQTILNLLRALLARNFNDAQKAYDVFVQWRARGGFDPSFVGSELVAELSNYLADSTQTKKYVLVYQVAVANLFQVDSFQPYSPRTALERRVYQGDFRTAEAIALGLATGGADVRIASCNIAGDVALHEWTRGLADCPFREKARPVAIRAANTCDSTALTLPPRIRS